MDEPVIIERIRKLRQEISEIRAANRIYWDCHQHTQAEKNDHEMRREQLQEIKSKLPEQRKRADRAKELGEAYEEAMRASAVFRDRLELG